MAYTKTTWEDLPSTNTPINATNLNKMENQIASNATDITSLLSSVGTNTSAIADLKTYVEDSIDVTSLGNWNSLPAKNGFYKGSGMSNSPVGLTINPSWWYVIQIVNDNTYVRQIAFSFRNDNQLIYSRAKQAGTWGNWEAIVESGSNTNGEYVKYADGTLICTKEITGTLGGNVWGNVYYSDHSIGSYAQTFTSLYYVGASVEQSQYWCNTNTNGTSVRVFRPNNGTITGTIKIFAIGKWK